MTNIFPNAKKLSETNVEALDTLKENAETEPNKYYIPAFKEGVENYKVPVTDFGKGNGTNNLIDLGYIYHDDSYYTDGDKMVDPDISNNPDSDEFIERIDEILAAGSIPFIMYRCNIYDPRALPSDTSWGTELPEDTPPIDPDISKNNTPTRFAPLIRIQYCSYYFANPIDNGYVIVLQIGKKVRFVKSENTRTYHSYIID